MSNINPEPEGLAEKVVRKIIRLRDELIKTGASTFYTHGALCFIKLPFDEGTDSPLAGHIFSLPLSKEDLTNIEELYKSHGVTIPSETCEMLARYINPCHHLH